MQKNRPAKLFTSVFHRHNSSVGAGWPCPNWTPDAIETESLPGCIWTYAKGTVEDDVIKRVVARLKGIEVIVGDDRHLAKEIESQMFAKIEQKK